MAEEVQISLASLQRSFAAASDKIITTTPRKRAGIGTQQEKTIHAVVKNMLEPDEQYQEVPVGSYIADICRDQHIYEIQTAGWGYLRDKLKAFLPAYHVTCVYPIPHKKWIIWVNPETGEPEKKNKSPLTGSFYEAFRELYRIRPYLTDPNLSILLLLIDMEEYRIRDGYAREGRKGSHRFDRIPLSLTDSLLLSSPSDYNAFLPGQLMPSFTAKDLQSLSGIHRKSVSFSQVLQILLDVGVVERIGRGSRGAYLYQKSKRVL